MDYYGQDDRITNWLMLDVLCFTQTSAQECTLLVCVMRMENGMKLTSPVAQ